ncbi:MULTISPECIES: NAD(P)-dependent oxidoreductase [Bacillaceae]|uniref:Putative oxidoreductase YkwC n=3 Tax=Bacillaceae TaxID=186817 RepID=A0A090KRD8_9BACI|nr:MULTISPECIES: NAD(P)-dependent oxidoreductase [Bacillaceae]KIO59172.1 2-hydroxy-3-oxopropionate reductase [Caldibacillus thermoamylovorans]KIO66958.1 2-hydroxy-3-oxopropionate reductase [Caldibacillus thermoamylovorans]MBU5341954.1 NAD(P)-dependent oxidoreductase [Caldifermentibacillus hisashii]MEC5273672.1 NAD(P)-dependent oxidoreductase [Caldifermentibacillus hisashii]MED3644835.1 NAD(P)-dependent oxidoreductase [Caldifermentibacillus hisashii]
MDNKQKPVVGFIGLGVMGKSMAGHILNGGYPLYVYTRTKEKAAELLDKGAIWAATPKEIAHQAKYVFTIIGTPNDVEEVYLGENGLITNGKENTYFIDMTTSSPTLAQRLYEEGKKKGIHVLDAPVSGGDIGAKEARLAIMVGGDQKDFDAVLPLFQLMGKNIAYFGKGGSGQHTKMANQIAIAPTMIGVCESLIYAKKAGLNVQKVVDLISTGAAASFSLSSYAPRILKEDYSPGFFIKHFIKDMTIALNEAEKMNLDLPGLTLAKQMYEKLAKMGEENSGTQALYKYWQ